MIKVRPAPKGTRKNLITRKRIILIFPVPMDRNPPSRRRENTLFVEGQVTMHLSADTGSKTTILLRKI